jgi:hypothetical protein
VIEIAGEFGGFWGGKKVLMRTMIEIGQIAKLCFRINHSELAQPLTEP